MKRSSEELVKFQISQDSMISESTVVIAQFEEDQAAFETFDADFATPFGTKWSAALKAALLTPADSTVATIMKLSSEEVEVKMEDCRTCFQSAKFFIEKAFPDNPTVWNVFGYHDYEAARKSHDKMPRFLTNFHTVAVEYKDELIAVNFLALAAANILVVRDALLTSLAKQHFKMGNRTMATNSRVKELNSLWETRQEVAKAAKVIFANDYTRYRMYLLPASEEHSDTYNFTGTVTELGTGKKLFGAKINLGNNLPMIFSDSNGKFGGAKIPAFSYTALVTLDGYLEKNVSVNIVDGEIFIAHIELEIYTG
jgi:hypothetical protein